ncbi:MAG: alpha/beta fold hydrolase [Actinomycetia bacterium]|nr:alpha/beta fold hydrolase [Actinomycetes bacterium]
MAELSGRALRIAERERNPRWKNPPLLPGAEPWSASGDTTGVLCLHGFTGNPSSMRGLAVAFAAAGHTVELPRLPGHGTTLEDMLTTTWADWSAHVEDVYLDLAARCERVFVSGLSMGGSLSLWLAQRHPEIAGLILVNPACRRWSDAEPLIGMLQAMVDDGEILVAGVGNDIADESVTESAYTRVPLPCLISLLEASERLEGDLANIVSPTLLMTSPQDHVVEPEQSDRIASAVSGPVERLSLDRSYHVATLDFDRELIEARAVAFVAGRVG